MMRFQARVAVLLASIALAIASTAAPQTQVPSIEVTAFEAQKGVDLPPDFQAALMEELVKQLTETGKFAQVLKAGESAPDGKAPTLRLTGVVTELDEGSRAARWAVGFGAGKAKIRAHVKFVDVATGAVNLEKDVYGRKIGGVAGGAAINSTRGLAKEVAKLAKEKL
jgi:hypothetical protein